MQRDEEQFGDVSVPDVYRRCRDPEFIRKITEAVRNLQEKIGVNGYVICRKCSQGLSGDPKTTIPSSIANYCTGDCEVLGLDKVKD